MRILGDRVLVTKVQEEVKEGGFEAVKIQDSFVFKGKVELIGNLVDANEVCPGDIILFAKYSPDTQEVDYNGQEAKIIIIKDILAIL
jgi:co-chaperonin GroES (HSP10)